MDHAPRILIVEDQYLVALDCEHSLQQKGFECTGLATTAAAYDMAERDRPDLIIMDARLGTRVEGVNAAVVIFEKLGIRCIFASGYADALTRKQAEPARPLGWLHKPYSHSELLAVVSNAVRELDGADGSKLHA